MTGPARRPDAVVIGAGAGGAAAAWALTRAGLRVTLLESGPRFEPLRDYPLTEPDWERHEFPLKPGSRGRILYGDLGEIRTEDRDLMTRDAVFGVHVPKATRREATPKGYDHVRGVGGTTLHFVGEAHRLHPAAFRLHSLTGQGADWPLSYADLEPDYAAAETVLGVAGPAEPADWGGRWRSAPFALPAHPPSPGAQRLMTAGPAEGLRFVPNARAALSRPHDGRADCNYCGNCSRGCPRGDKGSADVTFLRRAEQSGLLDLRTGAEAVALLCGPGGRIAAVEFVQDGRRQRIETPLLFLAGGAVQTPRLLLASAGRDCPEGVANGSGQVGRNFMETLHWAGTALIEGLRNSHMGLPADVIAWEQSAPGAVPGLAGGCRFYHATQDIGHVGPIAYARRLVPGHGAGHPARLRAAFGTALTVGAVGQVIADMRSRVELSPRQSDAHGLPLPVIHSVLTDEARALLRHMAQTGRRLLRAAGARSVAEEVSALDRFTSTHVFGTCRMGSDGARTVVDADCRAHDHGNLFITDASVFPTSGGGEAPSLTIQALALRAVRAALAG